MKTKGRLFLSLIIGLMLIQSINRVAAEIVWEEDFETHPFDWTLQGHEEWSVTGLAYPTNAVPEIKDGKLQMPVVTRTVNLSVSSAIRNSTVAYGTWSFDWEINSSTGIEHKAWVNVWFITDMPVNLTGVNLHGYFCEGYVLMLQSASEGYTGVPASCIYLWKRQKSEPKSNTLASYDIPGTIITGSHHIDITRSLDGTFNVWFDSTHIIASTDNSITTSERFFFRSHLGDSAFDNITVSDSVNITTTTETATTSESSETIETTTTSESSEYPQLLVLVYSISAIIILRKKRTR